MTGTTGSLVRYAKGFANRSGTQTDRIGQFEMNNDSAKGGCSILYNEGFGQKAEAVLLKKLFHVNSLIVTVYIVF